MYLHYSLLSIFVFIVWGRVPHCIQSDTSAQGTHRPLNGFIYDTQHHRLLFTFIIREFLICARAKVWKRDSVVWCAQRDDLSAVFLKRTVSFYIDLVSLQQFASNHSHYSVKREGVLTWWSSFITQKNCLFVFSDYFSGTQIFPFVCILGLILWFYHSSMKIFYKNYQY